MTQSATVIRIIDNITAEISVKRVSACSGECSSCGSVCGKANQITVRAVNKICAAVGDKVTVISRTGHIIGLASLVYLLPLLLFFVGYAVSAVLLLSEKLCIAISLGSFFVGAALVFLAHKHLSRIRPVRFEIIAIE